MKFLILLLVCDVLSQSPTASVTDLPVADTTSKADLPRAAVEIDDSPKTAARQNEIEAEAETEEPEPVSSSTLHFTDLACTEPNMEWLSCGPRCYQTCAFQPRGVRKTRAVCENVSSTGCYVGCFCKSGYVRINEKCILPIDCPGKSKTVCALKASSKPDCLLLNSPIVCLRQRGVQAVRHTVSVDMRQLHTRQRD